MKPIVWIILGVFCLFNAGLFYYFYQQLKKVQASLTDTVNTLQTRLSAMGLTDSGFKDILDDYQRLLKQEGERISDIDKRVKYTGGKQK
jgi:hypothetical protein